MIEILSEPSSDVNKRYGIHGQFWATYLVLSDRFEGLFDVPAQ